MRGVHVNGVRWLARRKWLVLFSVLVAADQLTKALTPRSWDRLDPGTGSWMPAIVSNLYRQPVTGALLDAAGMCVLVVAGWLAATRLRRPLARAGATVLLAGFASNLLDRLGLAALAKGVKERAVINWFVFGFGRIHFGNIADLCYGLGIVLLLAAALHALRHAPRGERLPQELRVPTRRSFRSVATVAALAAGLAFGWTGYWQGDRSATVASATIRTTEAHLQSTLRNLDQAVLAAYLRGDQSALDLLPPDQWIVCSYQGRAPCFIVTATASSTTGVKILAQEASSPPTTAPHHVASCRQPRTRAIPCGS